ncbi:MAG: hypothetical protein ACFFD4_19415 [Candidatus Odinarchaeota archaeon]
MMLISALTSFGEKTPCGAEFREGMEWKRGDESPLVRSISSGRWAVLLTVTSDNWTEKGLLAVITPVRWNVLKKKTIK